MGIKLWGVKSRTMNPRDKFGEVDGEGLARQWTH
jgi:hypothetical protein